ncbi:hypothetical protein [Hyphomonas sp.]|uniref:hypothetical protein n=1 Tax=Alphaproteobacteria TaxID=28211 RepID=UPI0032670B90
MTDLAISESHTLPVFWWLWWFAVASVVYGLLGVWFWKSLSRDRTVVFTEDLDGERGDRGAKTS